MRLLNLLKKNNMVIVGLNSGTSADGLDLAAIKFILKGKRCSINFLSGREVPYTPTLRKEVIKAISDREYRLDNMIRLDRRLGIFFGEEARKFCAYLARTGNGPEIVASHGQTIRHLPRGIVINGKVLSGTLQLGHPESIAEQTGLPVVADFRQGDIAAGGEGAPITTYAMWQLFSSKSESRLLINIGGIANYFLVPRGGSPETILARDCGPGNSLLDIITKKFFHRDYDVGGKIASGGRISMRLLSLLLNDNFLMGKGGVSTGRERFGSDFAEKAIKLSSRLELSGKDILATLTELTVISIVSSVGNLANEYGVRKIYLFGGGAKNRFLVRRLEANLPGMKFETAADLNYDSDYLEATCYAVMGGLTVHGIPTGLPGVTGSRYMAVGGRIVLPPVMNKRNL